MQIVCRNAERHSEVTPSTGHCETFVRRRTEIHHEITILCYACFAGLFRVSAKFALGLEGTLQRIERSEFRFPSLGSAITFDF